MNIDDRLKALTQRLQRLGAEIEADRNAFGQHNNGLLAGRTAVSARIRELLRIEESRFSS